MSRNISRLLLVLGLLVASAASAWAEDIAVKVLQKEGVGSYLADGKGLTLYYFTKDSPGKSVCTGECLGKWPPLMSEGVTAGTGLEAKDFGTLARDDGKQATYRGYPLYYFFKDANAGDTNGQGVAGVWFVIDPANFPPKK